MHWLLPSGMLNVLRELHPFSTIPVWRISFQNFHWASLCSSWPHHVESNHFVLVLLCSCASICTYMHIYTRLCMFAVCVSICRERYTKHAYIRTHMCIDSCMCISLSIYMCIYIYIYIYIYVYVHVYVYIYIYMYINTHVYVIAYMPGWCCVPTWFLDWLLELVISYWYGVSSYELLFQFHAWYAFAVLSPWVCVRILISVNSHAKLFFGTVG